MKYTITDAVIKKAKAMRGCPGHSDILKMVEFSAPVTHKLGNRRYDNCIFRVRKGVICDVNFIESATSCKPVKVICLTCDGDGDHCLRCSSTGYITLK